MRFKGVHGSLSSIAKSRLLPAGALSSCARIPATGSTTTLAAISPWTPVADSVTPLTVLPSRFGSLAQGARHPAYSHAHLARTHQPRLQNELTRERAAMCLVMRVTAVADRRIRRAALLFAVFAAGGSAPGCRGAADRAVQDSAAGGERGDVAPRRLASDATLTLFNTQRLAAPLRAVADSFGAREAVTILQESADSGGTLRTIADFGRSPDVIAVAADAFLPALMPAHTTWYVRFARDRIVLAYHDSSRGAATIDSASWWRRLQGRGVRVGRVDPASGSAGRRALLTMQLAESYYRQPRLAARLRAISGGANTRESEADLVAALDSGAFDYAWVHELTALGAGLRYLRLPHQIDLGEPADSALYAAAEVVLAPSSRGDTVSIRGAPIVYGVSIPRAAPSPLHAERFLRFLLSEEGRRVLEAAHLDMLAQPVVVGSDVPNAILVSLGSMVPTAGRDSVPAGSEVRDTARGDRQEKP